MVYLDEDMIPYYKCSKCSRAMCKDEMAGTMCIYCQEEIVINEDVKND